MRFILFHLVPQKNLRAYVYYAKYFSASSDHIRITEFQALIPITHTFRQKLRFWKKAWVLWGGGGTIYIYIYIYISIYKGCCSRFASGLLADWAMLSPLAALERKPQSAHGKTCSTAGSNHPFFTRRQKVLRCFAMLMSSRVTRSFTNADCMLAKGCFMTRSLSLYWAAKTCITTVAWQGLGDTASHIPTHLQGSHRGI